MASLSESDDGKPSLVIITALICTVLVGIISAIVMFSCFRKKKKGGDGSSKGKKNNKNNKEDKKNNAPSQAPSAAVHIPGVDIKPSVTVEDNNHHKPKEDNTTHTNTSPAAADTKNFVDSKDALGDFSAVRETPVLRSYRKAPPPQNRARQSRAPRALKSSAENLDIFSELDNDQLFEFNEDSTIKPSFSADKAKKLDKENDDNNDNDDETDARKKRGSSQGRSSMLDDINNTLASIQSSDSVTTPTDLSDAVKEKAQEVREEITSKIAASTVNAQVEEGVVNDDVTEKVNDDVTEKVKDVVEEEEKEEVLEEDDDLKVTEERDITTSTTTTTHAALSASFLIANKVDNDSVEIEKEAAPVVIEPPPVRKEEEIVQKLNKLKTDLEKSIEGKKEEASGQLQSTSEAAKEETGGRVDIDEIACEFKEKVQEKVTVCLPEVLKSEDASEESKENNEKINHLENTPETEILIAKSLDEVAVDKVPKKVPPKVSPKPSPKIKPRNEARGDLPSLKMSSMATSQELEEPSPSSPSNKATPEEILESVETKMAEEEKLESPPATPTSPTSPSSKPASRIPMTKKASGIPKLSFGTPKSSSASPLASPNSTGKRLEKEVKEIGHTLEKEMDVDVQTNNHAATTPTTPTTPTNSSEQPMDSESMSSSKEMSPPPSAGDDGHGSKRKLMKLRYSGRKKSSESKSDESGSERGSRAGSEAKSDDGKKTAAEEVDVEKKCRIPVRGGSKPRSSPPKTVGNQ